MSKEQIPPEATCSNCPWRGRDYRCHFMPPQLPQVGFAEQPPVRDGGWCAQHPWLIERAKQSAITEATNPKSKAKQK